MAPGSSRWSTSKGTIVEFGVFGNGYMFFSLGGEWLAVVPSEWVSRTLFPRLTSTDLGSLKGDIVSFSEDEFCDFRRRKQIKRRKRDAIRKAPSIPTTVNTPATAPLFAKKELVLDAVGDE